MSAPAGRVWLDPDWLDFGECLRGRDNTVHSAFVRCASVDDPLGYYAALGVSPDASSNQVKKAWRRRMAEVHPDRNPGDPRAHERFIEVQEAGDVLTDAAARTAYDGAIPLKFGPVEGNWWISAVSEPDDDTALFEFAIRSLFTPGHALGAYTDEIAIEVWDQRLTLTLRASLVNDRPPPSATGGGRNGRPGTSTAGADPPRPDPGPRAPDPAPDFATRLADAIERVIPLSRATQAALVFGAVGLLIIVVALFGGCDRTVTSPPIVETVTETETTSEASPTPPGTETSPTAIPTGSDHASLAVLDARGQEDPVQDVGRILDFTVESSADGSFVAKARPSGGAACAPTSSLDSGDQVAYANVTAGLQNIRESVTWRTAGSYLFCMWVGVSTDDPSSKVFSTTVVFRQPRGSIAFVAKPSRASLNRPITLRFFGRSEAPRALFVKERMAGGAGCAPTEQTDSGSQIVYADANGAFNATYIRTFDTAGTYLYCAWLVKSTDDTTPVAIRRFVLRVR